MFFLPILNFRTKIFSKRTNIFKNDRLKAWRVKTFKKWVTKDTKSFSKLCDIGLRNYRKFFVQLILRTRIYSRTKKMSSPLPLMRTLVYYLFFQNFSWCNTFPAEHSIFKHNSEQQREAIECQPNGKNTPESNPAVKDISNSLKSIRTACNRSKATNDPFSGCPSDWWLS